MTNNTAWNIFVCVCVYTNPISLNSFHNWNHWAQRNANFIVLDLCHQIALFKCTILLTTSHVSCYNLVLVFYF